MLNKLYVGFSKEIELPRRGYLFIDDEARDIPQSRVFDPKEHSFDLLKDIDYRKASDIVDALMTVFPGGENTLTKEGASHCLLEALLEKPTSLDGLIEKSKDPAQEKARRMVERVLMSPVLRHVLCTPKNEFPFKEKSKIFARVNRAELGEFDALVLGLLLMSHFKGQIIVPDFGFYGREAHISLIRENRLIAGLNFLGELPPKLRQSVMLIKEKVGSGTTYEDAQVLASYAGLYADPARQDNEYNRFVERVMA